MLDASADWKMRRAKKHLQQIEAAYRQVELENGHSLPFEVQIGAGQTGDFGRMVYPGPDWSLMVGDSVQNMRAALDHCTWALSSREVRNRRPNEIEFPIFDSRAKYSSGKAKRLRGVPDEAVAIIDTLQPFAHWNQNPHFHPLWLLHDLARIDRHRQIHVALMAVQGSLLKRDDASTQAAWVPVEGEADIDFTPGIGVRAAITLAAVAPGTRPDFAIHASVDVRFIDSGSATKLGVATTLRRIADFVQTSLDQLRPFTHAD